ncbi:MAG: L,D-transpeptidase family protein [Ruminococcus sp.]
MKKVSKRIVSTFLTLIIIMTATFTVMIAPQAATQENSISAPQIGMTGDPDPVNIENVKIVNKVKGLKVTKSSTNYICLKWNKEKYADGYTIMYRNPAKTKTYAKSKNTVKNSITIKNLDTACQYDFKVMAYIKSNGKIYNGESAYTRTATKPKKVTGLKVTNSSSSISIKWSKSSVATGYKIYRASAKSKGKYVLYKTTIGKSKNKFTDKSVSSNRVYYYRIKAYKKFGTKSYESEISKSVMAVGGLSAVTVTAKSQLGRVSLSWNDIASATGYKVYYKQSKNGTYKKLGTTKNNFYTTKILDNGKKYYFKVVPYKTVKGKNINAPKYKTTSKTVTKSVFGKNVGNTYIEVNIKEQHMWFYIDGKLYVDTDVVTGNADGYHDTPKGVHSIFVRQSPSVLVGADYRTTVQYWMQFTSDGCGIHDSTWRADWEYGGDTYKYNGSHGCVNTPYSKVAKIYSKAHIGTKVIVY